MLAVWLASACSAKERPAQLMDGTPVPVMKFDASSDPVVLGGGDSGVSAGDDLARQLKDLCESPPYVALLCYLPQMGHPSETAVFRNMDTRNGVQFSWGKDPSHNSFETNAGYQGHAWYLKLTAPTGSEIQPGSYSTDNNDGTTFTFSWDTGSCAAKESATFDIRGIAWDDMGVTTRMEIDFKHHCGDLTAPMAEGRYRLHSSLPP
jgi:hypothetical protein